MKTVPGFSDSTRLIQMSLVALLLLIAGVFTSCQPTAKPTAASTDTKHFDLNGKVVSVDKTKKEVTISHDDIPGYMPAMTMPFPLKDEWAFDVLQPGNKVGAKLVIAADSFWLENIVISASGDDSGGMSSEVPVSPVVGRELPSFRLVNQDDKPINTKQYRGKVLLLTFIYTRCPLPEYCTLMSTNFSEINRTLAKDPSLQNRTHLMSITIDPKYDTPKVLRSYGASTTGNYGKENFTEWEFVTGTPDEIKKIAEFFGLTYFEEKDQITHSLRTAVIRPDGTVFKVYPDNSWKPAEVVADVKGLLATENK
jgi:protein SCO1/2